MPNPPRKPGRPTLYRPEYCAKLIEHMGAGNSFESFSAKIGVSHNSPGNWLDDHEEFLGAKKAGLAANLLYWENIAKAGATGQLRRVSSETLDSQGTVVRKEYAPAVFNATVWVFTMKNMHGWRDRVAVHDGDRQDDLDDMTLDELEAEMVELQRQVREAKALQIKRKK